MAGCAHHRNGQAGCAGCQAEWRRYDTRRRARINNGVWLPRVTPDTVLPHVAVLRQAGMSLTGIAEAAGLEKSTLINLPKRRWLTGATAAAILAVQPGRRPRAGHVPTVRSARRVQALAALGWSFTAQGSVMQVTNTVVWEIANEVHEHVTETTHTRVVNLFERLSGTAGPSRRTVLLATRRGWLPPLAWEDIDAGTLGDGGVDASPVDEVAVERVLAGERIDLSDAELLAAAQIGAARGMTPWALSEVLRINVFGARKLMAGELPARRAKRAARAAGVAS